MTESPHDLKSESIAIRLVRRLFADQGPRSVFCSMERFPCPSSNKVKSAPAGWITNEGCSSLKLAGYGRGKDREEAELTPESLKLLVAMSAPGGTE